MEIEIKLYSSEIKIAIKQYLKNQYGISQVDNGDINFTKDNTLIDCDVICSGIYEITKPIAIIF